MEIKSLKVNQVKHKPGKPAQKTRIYIWPENESFIENLCNRRTRPYTQYRKEVIPTILKSLDLPADTKVKWSQYAGCTSCPCSPGFIVQDSYSKDVFVSVGEDSVVQV